LIHETLTRLNSANQQFGISPSVILATRTGTKL
jgi:hypothetical protein